MANPVYPAPNIGALISRLYEQSEYEKATTLYKQAIAILEMFGDKYHASIVEMNLGTLHFRFGKPAEGLLHLTKAATLFHLLSDTLNIARVESNLGSCYHALQNYLAAEQSFLLSIDAYGILQDHLWRINAVAGLGMTYIAAQQYNKAVEVLEGALIEIVQINEHPYYFVTLNYLQQYLAEAKQGQGVANNYP